MRRVLIFFLLGFLFFQSWTNAFALHELAPLHVIFGVVSIGVFVLYLFITGETIRTEVYKTEDLLLGLLLICLTLAAVIHPREASINYIAAYSYVFLGGFLVIKGAMYNYLSLRIILNWVLVGVLVTALGSIVEFGITFFFDIDLNPYLYRLRPSEAMYGFIFPRSAAFSTEPGILAFYLETLGLIAVWTLWKRSWSFYWKLIGTVTIFFGWILAFSAASVAALTVGGVLALTFKFMFSHKLYTGALPFLIVPLLLVGVVLLLQFAKDTLLGQILLKITLQGDQIGSAGTRLELWTMGLEKVAEQPFFGEGPGTASSEDRVSNISWYLFLMVEAGVLTSAPVFLFLAAKIGRIWNASVPGKYWYMTGFLAGAIHLSVISTFFHPFLWTLLIVFDISETRLSYKYSNLPKYYL